MLLCTLGFVLLFVKHGGTREFAMHNFWLFIVALVAVLVTIISLSCCEGVRRTSPTNIIFLSIFTIAESIMVAYATLNYEEDVVIIRCAETNIVFVSFFYPVKMGSFNFFGQFHFRFYLLLV